MSSRMAESDRGKVEDTTREVIAAANEAIDAARDLESVLDAEHKKLLRKVQRGPAAPGDWESMDRVGADLGAVQTTIMLLGLRTIRQLDAAADASELAEEIRQVGVAAKARTERLKKIQTAAKHLAKTVEAMGKLEEKLEALQEKAGGDQNAKPEPEERSTS